MAWFLKFSSHLSNQKFVSLCSEVGEQRVLGGSSPSPPALQPGWPHRNEWCLWVSPHPQPLLRLPSALHYQISRWVPFHDGNQSAPYQGGALGPTKMSSLEKTMAELH